MGVQSLFSTALTRSGALVGSMYYATSYHRPLWIRPSSRFESHLARWGPRQLLRRWEGHENVNRRIGVL